MFIAGKCDYCGECLTRCKYIDFEAAKEGEAFAKLVRGEPSEWLRKCITCFACNEYCPTGARPFDLILERLEALGDYVDPNLFNAIKGRFAPKGEFQAPAVKKPVISLCTIEPNMSWAFQGKIFAGADFVRGRHFFCNVLFPHIGNESVLRGGLQPLVDKYAALGVDEIVFVHDDCYALFTDLAVQYNIKVPFKPVHLFEHLIRYLKAHPEEIRPLNLTVAYQRPCASRYSPEKEPMLDEIFGLIGVTRVDRKYDQIEALCCGQALKGFIKRGEKYPEYQQLNIQDAQEHGAGTMVFLCPMCLDALYKPCKDAEMETYMISDLCRLAIGETLPVEAYQNLG